MLSGKKRGVGGEKLSVGGGNGKKVPEPRLLKRPGEK